MIMRTSVKDIYAAGDLISNRLAHGDARASPSRSCQQTGHCRRYHRTDAHKEEADGFTAGPSAHYEGTQGTSIARILILAVARPVSTKRH